MVLLFDRRCRITANGVTVLGDNPTERGLRCVFNVVQTISGEHQIADCTIFNLSDDSRSQIEATETLEGLPAEREFIIRAGYFEDSNGIENLNAQTIFKGNFVRALSKKTETDWQTEIKAADGHSAKFKVVNKAYKTPPTLSDMVRDISDAMGVDSKAALALLINPPARDATPASVIAATKERNIHARAQRILNRLADQNGFDWWVRNGELKIAWKHQTLTVEGVAINAKTGLLLSPERFIDNKQPKEVFIRFESFMNAALFPGQLLQVNSRTYNGQYKVIKATHQGDTHGPRWHTIVEALQL